MISRAQILKESYVRITEDEMEAWLYLCEPENGERYSREDLLEMLTNHGVTNGLNHSNISAMAKKGVYYREIKVAAGQPRVDGIDGSYEFYFTPENAAKVPKVREDGSVDYTSLKTLQNVKKGEQVALYHPAVLGTDGYTVKGTILQAKYARELPPLGGRSAIRSEQNPNLYLAAIDGKIQISDNKIDIQSVHEINEDVDMLTGKVEFYGDIVVNGNVESGVVIRAGRNITINGNVEACTLYAGGDIILQRGIQGAEKGKVTAKGSVFAEFIEYAVVQAGKNIQSNSIINSQIIAGERVIVDGKKGKIVGGYTHANMSIQAQTLGSISEVKTIVHTGFTEEQYNRIVQINKEETQLQQELCNIEEELRQMIRPGVNKLSKIAEVKSAECIQKRETCKVKLENLIKERHELRESISSGSNSFITVKGRIERGVVICIENIKMPLERSTSFTKYSAEHGVINGEVIPI